MDEPESVARWHDDRPTVAAVLVAHNGAAWLPKVLSSLASMQYAPQAWHVVDVSSTDGSADLLRDSFGAERITFAPSGTGFGDAVRLALDELPRTDWVWLLHDDSAVQPDTLASLLDEATSASDIAVVGPKVREWPSLRRLLEVGLSVTSTAGRETGLEPGEPDAGQHDRPRDVLAVNTAGMLVRRDVWDALGGLDPGLRLFGDDLDFGWRVARAGHRTRTAPTAVVFHAEASRREVRRRTAGNVPLWEPRRAALFVVLANESGPRFLWQYVRLFLGSLLRVMGFLIAGDPEAASDELLALRAVYSRPGRLMRARRERAQTATRRDRDIRHLFPPFWLPYLHGYDAVREALAAIVRPETVATAGRRSYTSDLAPDEAVDLDDGPSILRRHPWLVTVLVLTLVSLVAARGLFGGVLHGGALPPPPAAAGDWWRLVLEGRHDVGLASDALAPPFALLLAVASTPVWFRPGLVVWALVLLAVPLAGLTAHRLGRQLSAVRPVRIGWAVSYALCVVATGAVSQGRIGTLVALIVLPIVVNTAWQLAHGPGHRVALRLGIWVSVGAAFAPIVLPLSLLGLVLLAVLVRGRSWTTLLTAAVVPVVLLGPWVVQRALRPMRWWWEAGHPLPSGASAWEIALGRAGGPGEAPVWLGAGLVVLALLALVPRPTRHAVAIAWLVALLGLAVAVSGTFTTFTTPSGAVNVSPWVGVPTVVWMGGLAAAVLMAAPAALRLRRVVVVPLVVVALVLPVGTACWWVARGAAEPLTTASTEVVPAFLVERPGDTLVVTGRVDTGIDYRVVAGDGLSLGEEAVVRTDPAVTAAVRRLLANASPDDMSVLSRAGIDAVYAPDADPEVAQRIDAAPFVEQTGSDRPGSRVWTLTLEPAASHGGPRWHWAFGGGQAVLWLVAIVLTAPVCRRVSEAPREDAGSVEAAR